MHNYLLSAIFVYVEHPPIATIENTLTTPIYIIVISINNTVLTGIMRVIDEDIPEIIVEKVRHFMSE